MKKRTLKNLALKKSIVSNFQISIKGGDDGDDNNNHSNTCELLPIPEPTVPQSIAALCANNPSYYPCPNQNYN